MHTSALSFEYDTDLFFTPLSLPSKENIQKYKHVNERIRKPTFQIDYVFL